MRAASVTCFAGLTSSVFSALPKEKQDFVLNSSVSLENAFESIMEPEFFLY